MSKILDDYKRFCINCNWNDCDYGCTCPQNEEVYQCEMYMYYHPDEVNEFNKAMEEWANQKVGDYITLQDIVWTREIKENGDYKVSFTIPDEIFDAYEEEEIAEYLTCKLSELLEV